MTMTRNGWTAKDQAAFMRQMDEPDRAMYGGSGHASTAPKQPAIGRYAAFINRPPQPPKGFRKPIPMAVKQAVLLRQKNLCGCGECVDEPLIVGKGLKLLCEFDHRPGIEQRRWDEKAQDTIPACNDPAYIFALRLNCHDRRTRADATTRAKTKRRQKKADAHAAAMAEKAPGVPRKRTGTIRSRGFPKRERV